MRLFVGFNLPPAVRAELGRVQSLLRPAGADVRWVRSPSAHLTLAFLGNVGGDEIVPLTSALTSVASRHRPVSLRLRGAGSFPAAGNPRVAWLGVDDAGGALATLYADLHEAVAHHGLAGPRRRYHAHVTLGRVRGPRGTAELRRLLETVEVTPCRWRAEGFALFQSHLSPRGARYEVLSRYRLGESL